MLRRATNSDLEAIQIHLRDANLVLEGVEDHLEHFWLYTKNHQILATAGLEVYGNTALLRSVAVDPSQHGQGLGRKIVRSILEYAVGLGVQEIVLLTQTAPNYFLRFGFQIITRDAVPKAVKNSVEFQGACPDDAIIMQLKPIRIRPAEAFDALTITRIYNQGIEDRIATFETQFRQQNDVLEWFNPQFPFLVALQNQQLLGFIRASSYRTRDCYAGIAEYSVYVAREAQHQGIGDVLMNAFIPALQEAGFWKVLSRIFPENTASRALCARHGFREVGLYQKHALLDGIWRDCVIVERILV